MAYFAEKNIVLKNVPKLMTPAIFFFEGLKGIALMVIKIRFELHTLLVLFKSRKKAWLKKI